MENLKLMALQTATYNMNSVALTDIKYGSIRPGVTKQCVRLLIKVSYKAPRIHSLCVTNTHHVEETFTIPGKDTNHKIQCAILITHTVQDRYVISWIIHNTQLNVLCLISIVIKLQYGRWQNENYIHISHKLISCNKIIEINCD